jgi:hypothetical protein
MAPLRRRSYIAVGFGEIHFACRERLCTRCLRQRRGGQRGAAESERWWFVGGCEPGLVASLFVGDPRFVGAPFGGDAVLVFLYPGAFASPHHQSATLARLFGQCADRDFAGGSRQYREEQAAAGFGGVGPVGEECRIGAPLRVLSEPALGPQQKKRLTDSIPVSRTSVVADQILYLVQLDRVHAINMQ